MNRTTISVLKEFGIPAHLMGYEYIAEAVESVLADRTLLYSVTSRLYPLIAEKFNTTPTRVERAIRTAFTSAFDNLTPEQIEELFGNALNPNKDRASNSQFIATLVAFIKENY